MNKKERFDIVVIGSGPGGYAAAFYAADCGKKVALVEKKPKLGGVCLNVGCIPSKALLHLSALKNEVEEVKNHGLVFGSPKIDFDKIRDFKNSVIGKMNKGLEQLSKARKIQVIYGKATFNDRNSIYVLDEKEKKQLIEFDNIIIAVGSRPFVPQAFQIKSSRLMDSTQALELKDFPKKLLIVGGGIIGLEMGSVYASFGSQVTLIESASQIAGDADRDLIKPLENRLKRQFKEIMVDTTLETIKDNEKSLEIFYKNKENLLIKDRFDKILLSIGRIPNSDQLNLERAGVNLDDKNHIIVDRQMRTNIPHIYAIGDVVGQPMLAHKASAESRVAVDAILGKKEIFDFLGIPSVIYTDPEVAWVGLTETKAKKESIDCKVAKFPWAASGRATTINRNEGMTKILFDPKTERILGAGIVGVNAGEIIAEASLALEMRASVDDITGTIHAHPTLSESILEASESFHGVCTHLYTPNKK